MRVLMVGSIPPPFGGVNNHVYNLAKYLRQYDDVYLVPDRPLEDTHVEVKVLPILSRVPNTTVNVSPWSVIGSVFDNLSFYKVNAINGWTSLILRTRQLQRFGLQMSIESLYAPVLEWATTNLALEVIHAHHASDRAFRSILFSRKQLGLPVVVTMHRGEFSSISPSSVRLLNYVFENSSRLIAVSSYIKRKAMALGATEHKIEVVPNAVDHTLFRPQKASPAFLPSPKDSFLILFVGGLNLRKGIMDLIKAIQLASRDLPRSITLVAVGTGPLKKEVISSIEHAYWFDKVSEDELVRIYNSCDLFVLPSYEEGLSTAVLEAMSCGKAVITTYDDTTGHDAITHLENGYLTKAGDVGLLADGIRQVLRDDDLRKKMGDAARHTIVTKFSWNLVAERIHGVYRDVQNPE